MPLNKRSKVSAEFSMSSLTDIIFLLLIFFMLTSSLVQIQPFDLPESDSKVVAPSDLIVSIDEDGAYTLNGKSLSRRALPQALALKVKEIDKGESEDVYVTIVSEVNNRFNETLEVMKIANNLRIKAIIATQPRK